MIDFKKAKFVISCPDFSSRPPDPLKEVVFLGKSNVGKSTLINSLVGQKIAFSSKKAGKTKLLNYFSIDNGFYLVDAPGYGYTQYGSREDEGFADMMEPYFHNPKLALAILLVDIRRLFKEDELGLLHYMKELNIPYIVVYTKSDTANQKIKNAAINESKRLGVEHVFYSGTKADYKTLRSMILAGLNASK